MNKYQLDEEGELDLLEIDNQAVRESQVRRLEALRAKRDAGAVERARDELVAIALKLDEVVAATRGYGHKADVQEGIAHLLPQPDLGNLFKLRCCHEITYCFDFPRPAWR